MKRHYSLKKNEAIKRVLDQRQNVRDRHFSIHQRKNHEISHFRFAISIPKKYGNAVERNLMRRRLRMIIAEQPIVKSVDFFVIVSPNAKTLTYAMIKTTFVELLLKAKLIEVKK